MTKIAFELRRREFLIGAAAAAVAACDRRGTAASADSGSLDAVGQAAAVRRGDLTPRELVEATISRIEKLDGPINAVITRTFERALEQADGPLPAGPFRGVPILLKDLNDLAGVRTSMGSRLFADYVPSESSPHALKTIAGGFVVLGKTNTPEFGLLATTEPTLFGPCRNPWDLRHSTGGSSGGAAAAVASGMVPIAQASDGGGSIRIPASCCGVFGLKPSRGRNRAVDRRLAVDTSVRHVVSRSVRDSAAFLAMTERRGGAGALAPVGRVEGPSKSRLRIAFHTANIYGSAAEPEVERAMESTAALCAELGHRLELARPEYRGAEFREHFLNLWSSAPASVVRYAEERGTNPAAVLEPVTLGLAAHFRALPPDAMEKLTAFFREYERAMAGFFDSYDVLLTPVLRTPPVRLATQSGNSSLDEILEPLFDYSSYTPVWNTTGAPAMSVPLGWSRDGLPIGSHFVGRLGAEASLLALAYELEAARPWADRRPRALS